MKDIAADLGVSLMTVSKALRGHHDISEETKRRVIQRATELGYQPNWAARSLATGRTQLIGMVVPDLMHSFFAEIAKNVNKRLEPHAYQTVICSSDGDTEVESQQIEFLLARNVEGLIVASAHLNAQHKVWKDIQDRKIPCILIDRYVAGFDTSFVGCNDLEIARIAIHHLLEQGYQRIAHIRGPSVSTGEGRYQGYCQTLLEAGMEIRSDYIVEGSYDDINGYAAMKRLLAVDPRPDAVFCYNDPVAAGALRAAIEEGIDIPGDLGIIGVGNIHYSDLLRFPLSTVDLKNASIGEATADLLLRTIQKGSSVMPEQIFISPRLIARESTRRV